MEYGFFEKCNPVYFLDFVKEKKKKIAYAASIGLPDVPEKDRAEFKKYVENFNLVTTREVQGKELVEKYTDKECHAVLDPTLLYDKNYWSKLANHDSFCKKYSDGEPYIFCYTFNCWDLPFKIIDSVAKITGMRVITIPWSDIMKESSYIKVYDAGPLDFLSLLKNAELVITDSFHGTAFSINFNKQFYSFLRSADSNKMNMNSRIYSILQVMGLENRLVHGPIDKIEKIDYTKVNKILDDERINSQALLKGALDESFN